VASAYLTLLILFSLFSARNVLAQSPATTPADAVRVRVAINADGSRTTYQFDNEHRTAISTTVEPDGTARGKIRYELDESGHFKSGLVFGPDDTLRFKALYKYGAGGRLEEETHLGKDDAVVNKIVYKYDAAGKPAGYSVFDASGKLLSGPGTPTPTPSPRHRNALGR
jgi:hypothetical protein